MFSVCTMFGGKDQKLGEFNIPKESLEFVSRKTFENDRSRIHASDDLIKTDTNTLYEVKLKSLQSRFESEEKSKKLVFATVHYSGESPEELF